jgi:predicted transposase YbfD/YdcC
LPALSADDKAAAAIAKLRQRFSDLKDPRVERTKEHQLLDIFTIAICAVICGADGYEDMAEFGKAKRDFFERFLELPNGIPSHDTFGRLFARIQPAQFEACFAAWVQDLVDLAAGQVVGIDGKCLRRSADKADGKAAIYMVSAWASANGAGMVLAQRKVAEKSNEITAIPELLKLLDLSGCIVTIDAMGTQTAIADAIIAQQADYVLALKGNQGTTHEQTQALFEHALGSNFKGIAYQQQETVDGGHGRIETRRYYLITAPSYIEYVNNQERWAGLRAIGLVEAERLIDGVVSKERRYYISSLSNVADFARGARGHWGIENGLHWVLDIAFREDESRVRKDHGAENMAVLRHIALNLLKRERSKRGASVHTKRLTAGWDERYLLTVLAGI